MSSLAFTLFPLSSPLSTSTWIYMQPFHTDLLTLFPLGSTLIASILDLVQCFYLVLLTVFPLGSSHSTSTRINIQPFHTDLLTLFPLRPTQLSLLPFGSSSSVLTWFYSQCFQACPEVLVRHYVPATHDFHSSPAHGDVSVTSLRDHVHKGKYDDITGQGELYVIYKK